MLPALIEGLGDLDPEVITDPDPEGIYHPWRAFQECLRHCPGDTGHLLIIQDDAVPCKDFDLAARTALSVKPDKIVCFYVGGGRAGEPLAQAALSCKSWAALRQDLWIPLVATAFPVVVVRELQEWAATDHFALKSRWDDAVLGRFMRAKGITAWATVPNLVQHPDVAPSLIKRTAAAGRDKNRVAVCWIDDHPASEIVW